MHIKFGHFQRFSPYVSTNVAEAATYRLGLVSVVAQTVSIVHIPQNGCTHAKKTQTLCN